MYIIVFENIFSYCLCMHVIDKNIKIWLFYTLKLKCFLWAFARKSGLYSTFYKKSPIHQREVWIKCVKKIQRSLFSKDPLIINSYTALQYCWCSLIILLKDLEAWKYSLSSYNKFLYISPHHHPFFGAHSFLMCLQSMHLLLSL